MTGYLKCDAPGCDHLEEHEEVSADLVNKPCPKCGANLLTEEDYISARGMMPLINLMKKVGLVADHDPNTEMPEGMQLVNFNCHEGVIKVSSGGPTE